MFEELFMEALEQLTVYGVPSRLIESTGINYNALKKLFAKMELNGLIIKIPRKMRNGRGYRLLSDNPHKPRRFKYEVTDKGRQLIALWKTFQLEFEKLA